MSKDNGDDGNKVPTGTPKEPTDGMSTGTNRPFRRILGEKLQSLSRSSTPPMEREPSLAAEGFTKLLLPESQHRTQNITQQEPNSEPRQNTAQVAPTEPAKLPPPAPLPKPEARQQTPTNRQEQLEQSIGNIKKAYALGHMTDEEADKRIQNITNKTTASPELQKQYSKLNPKELTSVTSNLIKDGVSPDKAILEAKKILAEKQTLNKENSDTAPQPAPEEHKKPGLDRTTRKERTPKTSPKTSPEPSPDPSPENSPKMPRRMNAKIENETKKREINPATAMDASKEKSEAKTSSPSTKIGSGKATEGQGVGKTPDSPGTKGRT